MSENFFIRDNPHLRGDRLEVIGLEEAKETEESMTMDEIVRKHWGRWVAIRVVERDEAEQPKRGIVLHHSPDRYHLANTIKDEEAACIFYAGPIPRGGGPIM